MSLKATHEPGPGDEARFNSPLITGFLNYHTTKTNKTTEMLINLGDIVEIIIHYCCKIIIKVNSNIIMKQSIQYSHTYMYVHTLE